MEQSISIDTQVGKIEEDKDTLLKQQENEIKLLRSQLEQQKTSTGETKEKVQNAPTVSNNNNVGARRVLVEDINDNEIVMQNKLNSMENEIALLRSLLINQNQNSKQQFPSTPEWNGELNLNHPGIEALAKSLHKKFKDVELPSDFNFSVPAGRGANELIQTFIFWELY